MVFLRFNSFLHFKSNVNLTNQMLDLDIYTSLASKYLQHQVNRSLYKEYKI